MDNFYIYNFIMQIKIRKTTDFQILTWSLCDFNSISSFNCYITIIIKRLNNIPNIVTITIVLIKGIIKKKLSHSTNK